MNAKIVILLLVGAFFMACGRVPETQYFTLEWQQLSEPKTSGTAVLHIQQFDAAPMLKYDKMMYKTSMYEVKYDNYRRWVMTPASLLAHKAADYFQESGLFESVVVDIPRGQSSYSLFGHINHFEEIDYGKEHSVHISVTFELTNLDERQPLLTTLVEKKVEVKARTVNAIVEAMSEATRLVFDDLSRDIKNVVH